MRIELSNRAGRLRPGMFALVDLGDAARPALLVPSEAVNKRSEYADGGIRQCGLQLAQRGEKNGVPTRWPHLLEGLGCIADTLAGELGHARLMLWIECSRKSA